MSGPVLGLLAGIGLLGAVLLGRVGGGPEAPGRAGASTPAPGTKERAALPVTAESLATLVERDPFRLSRRPAGIAYNPLGPVSHEPTPPPPRPALVVSGILWGEKPVALIEGIPGTEGPRLIRLTEVVNGYRVTRIERRQVRVVGPDTTWTLPVREPWQ